MYLVLRTRYEYGTVQIEEFQHLFPSVHVRFLVNLSRYTVIMKSGY
jgi:hypothetical protein